MTGRDRISNLLDDVIGDILSRLSTEDAVKTSVLSKSWKYKWTFINHIIIDDETNLQLGDLDHPVFVKCVERTLGLVQNATRIRIKLSSEQSSDALKSWMVAVSRHRVEDLELVIQRGNIVLSSSLLNVTKLRNFYLSVPSFAVSSKNHFPKLTSLHLWKVGVMNPSDGTDGTLTFTFPVLEKLMLVNCRWVYVKSVEIHAPALSMFGARLHENLILNGSAVVRAEWCIYVEDENLRMSGVKVRSLLRQMSSSLKCLRLSVSVAKAILESKQEYSYPRMRLEKLELLSLNHNGSRHPCGIQALLEFLHAAPSLEHLSIELAHWIDFDCDAVESVPSCITSSLKIVKLLQYHDDRPLHGLEKLFQKAAVRIKRCKSNEEDE